MKTNNMLKSFSMLDNLIIQFVEKMIRGNNDSKMISSLRTDSSLACSKICRLQCWNLVDSNHRS